MVKAKAAKKAPAAKQAPKAVAKKVTKQPAVAKKKPAVAKKKPAAAKKAAGKKAAPAKNPAKKAAAAAKKGGPVAIAPFGPAVDGKGVSKITLTMGSVVATVSNFGATLLSVRTKGKGSTGTLEEVTLNHSSPADVTDSSKNMFFGKTAGRFANRIAKGRFELDGKKYTLATNNGPNHLHGGNKGFDQCVWTVAESGVSKEGSAFVTMQYLSADGEEGFPGKMMVSCKYQLSASGSLGWTLAATSTKATPVNLCNHTYWNLSGGCKTDILDHTLELNCDGYLPVDKDSIPTGKVAPVKGTPFDFTAAKTIAKDLGKLTKSPQKGFDHCLVIAKSKKKTVQFDGKTLTSVAKLSCPASGRVMSVFSTTPGVQLYTGNFLDGEAPMGPNGALCLETECFPDAINRADWRESVILRPGELWEASTVHVFQ